MDIKLRKNVLDSFGNDSWSGWHYIVAIVINIFIHITIALFTVNSLSNSILS